MGFTMSRLFTVPLGATARDKFIAEIKALPKEAKPVLVLPNISLLRQVQYETSIHCMSFDYLANRILNMNGYVNLKALNSRQQELIIESLISDFQASGSFQYFINLGHKQGFVKAMAALIGELSKSGLDGEAVREVLSQWRQDSAWAVKDRDIALLYTFYRIYLQEHNLFDLAGKYRLASFVLQGKTEQNKEKEEQKQLNLDVTHVYFADFSSFDNLQLQLLKDLSKHVEINIGLTYEKEREQVFGPVQDTYNSLLLWCSEQKLELERQGAVDCQRLTAYFGGSVTPAPLADKNAVQLYQFTNSENEVSFVLQRVKELLLQGVKTEDIVITMRDTSQIAGIAELGDKLGIPLALPRAAALALQPLNEILELAWQCGFEGHDSAEAYLSFVGSGLGTLLWGDMTAKVLLLRKEHFFTSIGAVRKQLRGESEEHSALAIPDNYIDSIRQEANVKEYVTGLLDFLDKLGLKKRLGELHQQGKIALAELQCALLTEQKLIDNAKLLLNDYTVCNFQEAKLSLGEWLDLWRASLQGQEVSIGFTRFNGIAVKPVTALQGTTKPYVFLLGMQEGIFPKLQHESWIYSDKERATLTSMDLKLGTTAEGYGRELFYFATTLGLVRKSLVVTFYEDDDNVVSPYVDQLRGVFSDLQITRILPARAVKPQKIVREVVQESNINIPVDRQARSFSASSLETYAKCPFAYLGDKLWGLDAYTPRQEKVDPATEGNLLHKVLEVFVGLHLHEKLTGYEQDVLWQQLQNAFEAVEKDFITHEIIYDVIQWRAERSRVLGLLRKWLDFTLIEQSSWQGFTPEATEWSFGFGKNLGLSLRLQDGSFVKLKGKVDRLDSNGDTAVVTDYKRSSGSAPSGSEQADGLDLQLPVYMLAVARLQHKKVASGNYLILRDTFRKSSITYTETGNVVLDKALGRNQPLTQKGTKRNDFIAETWEQFETFCERLLCKYIDNIYQGYFPVQPVGSACTYCAFSDICRKHVDKLQDEEVEQ